MKKKLSLVEEGIMFTNTVDPSSARMAYCPDDYNMALKYNSYTREVDGRCCAFPCSSCPLVLPIGCLIERSLREPIQVILEPDGDGYIARSVDLPIYGYGDDIPEALQALKIEIESLYDDLMEDDDFSPEFLNIKSFLKAKVIDEKF